MKEQYPWFALRLRSNFEYATATILTAKGYEVFLPTYLRRQRRRGEMMTVKAPLFPGYIFCRFSAEARLPILVTPGVVMIVGIGQVPQSIPDVEIASVRCMVESQLEVGPWTYVSAGERIRIEQGPLTGAEGVLLRLKDGYRLVASVTLFQRSISVELDRDWVTPLSCRGQGAAVGSKQTHPRPNTGRCAADWERTLA
jgi:transcription antitermination factor NusG